MVLELYHLGGMELGSKHVATSHDVVAGFVLATAAGTAFGFVRVDAVSSFADG
jgi:ABC-type nitrate/sulfonate/bicarbonate transport system permease component